jgi:hypothetical protein
MRLLPFKPRVSRFREVLQSTSSCLATFARKVPVGVLRATSLNSAGNKMARALDSTLHCPFSMNTVH